MSLAILLLTAPVLGEELVRKGGNSAPYHDWQGHPVHPRFDLTAEVLDFGILIIGEDKEMVVTVTNTSPGNIPLRISLPNDCEGFSLPAIRGKHPLESGRSVEIRVAFSADDPGFYDCYLDLGQQVIRIPLYAFVMHPDAGFELSPEALDYSEVVLGNTGTINLKITNTGLTTYQLDPGVSGDADVFTLVNDLSGYALDPGTFVYLTVAFDPVDATNYGGTLFLAADLPRPLLTGTGVEPIQSCTLSTATLEFGPISPGTSQTLTVGITNTGNVELAVTPSISGTYFSIVGAGTNLPPGLTLTIPVTFTPLSLGMFNGTLDLGTPLCAPVVCTGLTEEGADPEADNIGFFFDEGLSLTSHNTTGTNEVVNGYLALVNPSNQSGVAGWECWLDLSGNAFIISSVLEGNAINIGGNSQYIVGIGTEPLPYSDGVLLASFQILVPTTSESVNIELKPVYSPSQPGLMTWLSWDDVNDLKPMFPYGGNALVAVINGAAGAQKSGLPSAVSRIVGNAPNPFNPMTKVQFELAAPGQVRLAVFDVTGRLVKVLHQGPLAAGPHTRVWQGEDSAGRRAASGVYYLRMETDGEAHHRKMMLLK